MQPLFFLCGTLFPRIIASEASQLLAFDCYYYFSIFFRCCDVGNTPDGKIKRVCLSFKEDEALFLRYPYPFDDRRSGSGTGEFYRRTNARGCWRQRNVQSCAFLSLRKSTKAQGGPSNGRDSPLGPSFFSSADVAFCCGIGRFLGNDGRKAGGTRTKQILHLKVNLEEETGSVPPGWAEKVQTGTDRARSSRCMQITSFAAGAIP